MRIFQAVTDFRPNSFWRVRVNFRRRQIFVQLRTENRCKRPTLVADLTNFLFEYFYAVFTHDSFWPFLYHDAKKVKNAKKSNQGGGGYCLNCSFLRDVSRQWGLCALHHGIQISMEAILACHPARSTEWLDWYPKSYELWRTHKEPLFFFFTLQANTVIHLMLALIWWLR